jgi:uncharacterized phosphosugar-binding protein
MPTNDRAERNHAPLGWIAREKSEMPDDQPFGKELFWRSAAVVLDRVVATQSDAIQRAATVFADAIQHEGVIQAYGTGHSQAFAMELANRAGGLVSANRLSLLDLVQRAGWPAERVRDPSIELDPQVGGAVLDCYRIEPHDVFIIASNSGVNPAIVHVAQEVKRRGHTLLAVTSMEHARQTPSRDASALRLYELADIVIDNCGPVGDALLELPGGGKACSVSSLTGALIAQMLTAETIGILLRRGQTAPVLISANVSGGRESNALLVQRYAGRIA